MSFMEQMQELFTVNNMVFLLDGLYLTLYISVIAIFLSSIFGTILAIMRNRKRITKMDRNDLY